MTVCNVVWINLKRFLQTRWIIIVMRVSNYYMFKDTCHRVMGGAQQGDRRIIQKKLYFKNAFTFIMHQNTRGTEFIDNWATQLYIHILNFNAFFVYLFGFVVCPQGSIAGDGGGEADLAWGSEFGVQGLGSRVVLRVRWGGRTVAGSLSAEEGGKNGPGTLGLGFLLTFWRLRRDRAWSRGVADWGGVISSLALALPSDLRKWSRDGAQGWVGNTVLLTPILPAPRVTLRLLRSLLIMTVQGLLDCGCGFYGHLAFAT